MSVPTTFFGSTDSLYVADATGPQQNQDTSNPIPFLVRTRPVAPGGAAIDVVLDRFFLALTWSCEATLTVTPIMDGELLASAAVTIPLVQGPRRSVVVEHVVRMTIQHEKAPPLMLAPRGTWVSFQIESPGVKGPGTLVLDSLEVEWEPSRAGTKRRE